MNLTDPRERPNRRLVATRVTRLTNDVVGNARHFVGVRSGGGGALPAAQPTMEDTEEAVTNKTHLAQEVDTADLRTKFVLKGKVVQIKQYFLQETKCYLQACRGEANPKPKSAPAAKHSKKTSSSRKSAGATA